MERGIHLSNSLGGRERDPRCRSLGVSCSALSRAILHLLIQMKREKSRPPHSSLIVSSEVALSNKNITQAT